MKKPKQDPTFGVRALQKLDALLDTKIQPLPKLKEGKKARRVKRTNLYLQRMRYLHGFDDDDLSQDEVVYLR